MPQSVLGFENYISTVLQSKRNSGKAIILCEGRVDSVQNVGVNPSMYRKLERVPDANFYTKCLPKAAQLTNKPQFYTCGSRNDVLRIYTELCSRAALLGSDSYVDPDKIFAIVDLDIQSSTVDNYNFDSTESIFRDLYSCTKISCDDLNTHKIFVTGLIHKEAYFLLDNLHELYKDYKLPILHEGSAIDFKALYKTICLDSLNDRDVELNFDTVKTRLGHLGVEFDNTQELVGFLIDDGEVAPENILNLFLFGKAKPHWANMDVDSTYGVSKEQFQEQLSMEIAKFYSDVDDDDFHLTAILKSIYFQAHGIEL